LVVKHSPPSPHTHTHYNAGGIVTFRSYISENAHWNIILL